jgi:VanZ family protein
MSAPAIDIDTTPALRTACLVGFLAMTAQLLLLAEPNFAARLVALTWDKAIHFLFFGTMAFLLWIVTAKRWPLAVWLAVAFIGFADETLQASTPGRSADFYDWLADGFGAAAALIVSQRVSPQAGAAAGARPTSKPGG